MKEFLAFFTSPQFFVSLAIIAVACAIWLLIKKLFRPLTDASKTQDSRKLRTAHTLRYLLKCILLVLTVLTVLQINGINVSSLVASLGLVSAVIGLALQDFLKDIIMGFHIMTDHFFAVGDVVRYQNIEGTVISFTAKTVKLENIFDHSIMTICNRNISEITVCSRQFDLDVPLSYEEDTAKIHRALEEICRRIAAIDGIESCSYKGTYQFGASSVLYKIFFFCDPKEKYPMLFAAMRTLQDGLQAADLTIPYNQLDIHQK